MANIFDVAKIARVSTATVSLAMRDSAKLTPTTKLRVQAVASKLNYRPSKIARSLVQRKTNTIGVILPGSSNPIYIETSAWIERAAAARGYDTLAYFIDEDPGRERRFLEKIYEQQVDGLILIPAYPDVNREHYLRLAEARVPLVIRDHLAWLPEVDSVSIDMEKGGYAAARHLLELGHTRIAYVQNEFGLGHGLGRRKGYQRALQDQGVAVDESLIRLCGIHLEDGYKATQSLLALRDPPTAIFFQCDLLAMGAMAAIRAAGLRLPKDLSVVGFDDISYARYLETPLTTVAQPQRQLAEALCAALVRRIGCRNAAPRHASVVPELVVRKSSGPCPFRPAGIN